MSRMQSSSAQRFLLSRPPPPAVKVKVALRTSLLMFGAGAGAGLDQGWRTGLVMMERVKPGVRYGWTGGGILHAGIC